MEKRVIKKIAVLGSGVMGSRIACHFAGIGVQVLLLDIVPEEARDSTNPAQRNKIVNDSLQAALKSNPSGLYARFPANRENLIFQTCLYGIRYPIHKPSFHSCR